jgi:O-antigen ligase
MRLLLAMIAVMPFEENPYLKLASNFLFIPEFTVIKLLGLVGVAWVVVQVAGGVRIGIFDSGQAKAFALFLALATFSGFLNGAGYLVSFRLLSIACFLPLVLCAVRTERDLRGALMAAALVLILIFPYAYRNMLRFGGRLGVGLYDPNYYALGLLLVVPLAWAMARLAPPGRMRMLWYAGFAVLVLQVIMTGSRGGALGLTVILALLSTRLTQRRVATLAGLAGLGFLLIAVVPNSLGERLIASIDPEYRTTKVTASDRVREAVMLAGIEMIKANPLTGVGLGVYKAHVMAYGAHIAKIAHSTYIHLAAELGVPALLAFLLVILVALRSLRRSERLALAAGNRTLHHLAVAIQVGLAGWAVSATFLSAQYEKFYWLVMFLTICLERVVSHATPAAPAEVPPPGRGEGEDDMNPRHPDDRRGRRSRAG